MKSVYQDYFNFDKEPFSIAPDPSFLYLSQGHREALAHLMYGFEHGGFVLITGEVGTGKTTLLRNLIKQTPPDLDVAFILNPRLTVGELLETICEELGIPFDKNDLKSVKQYIDVLNRHLLRTHQDGRSTVVIIDEAQNLSPAVLEQIRLLTNLETNERKLLRIILLGQPELDELLNRSELRQLAQRITARYHLTSLNRDDCYAYVSHRLSLAGGNPDLFTDGGLSKLFHLSNGTPRLVNIIADRALLGAYVEGKKRVTRSIVGQAATEVLGQQRPYRWWLAVGVVGLAGAGMALAWFSTPATVAPATASEPIAGATQPLGAASEPAILETPVATMEATSPATVDVEPPAVVAAHDTSAEAIDDAFVVTRPDQASFATQRLAYAIVFQHWGHDFPTGSREIPCDFAPRVGLQCLGLNGSWSDIERLNLPVVLELWDAQETPFYGAITSSQGGRYAFHLGNDQHDVTPKHLRDVWFGRYVVLWQTPPGYHGSLREGDEHSSVGWLRVQLANILEIAPSPVANRFDSSLHDAVTAFQQQEGLLTDGIVGPATWIRLADRLQLATPKLRS